MICNCIVEETTRPSKLEGMPLGLHTGSWGAQSCSLTILVFLTMM